MGWIDGITDQLWHLGDISARTMFDGRSLYCQSVLLAIAQRR